MAGGHDIPQVAALGVRHSKPESIPSATLRGIDSGGALQDEQITYIFDRMIHTRTIIESLEPESSVEFLIN